MIKKKNIGDPKEKYKGTSTADAVLGLLSISPMSGYSMRTLIGQSIGHFWSESFGQIYPALKRLSADGCVVRKTERQKGRPDRHVYSLTAKGTTRLEQWLEVAPENEVPRNELLLKLFFGSQVPLRVSRRNVEQHVERQRLALKAYEEIGRQIETERKDDPQAPFWLMTVNYGRCYSEALLKWGRETLKELDALEKRRKKKTKKK